mgnify:CR=1 FL=1
MEHVGKPKEGFDSHVNYLYELLQDFQMNIAVDFDGTYDLEPKLWNQMMATFRIHGHKVYLVTARYPDEVDNYILNALLSGRTDGIYYTSKKAKKQYMLDRGIEIDVWIDDKPKYILEDKA